MTNADIISLIDLTRLQERDNVDAVSEFAKQAMTPLGNVAAVCVYAEFVSAVKAIVQDSTIAVATVANFPTGECSLDDTLATIRHSINDGADEIDVVMPYKKLIAGDLNYVNNFLVQCREATQGSLLKVIIESGALTAKLITQATSIVAAIGADFVKTSTGKIAQGASLEAVEIILQTLTTIQDSPGIKISGGVRSKQQVQDYLQLITHYMGHTWITSQHVRIGASQLLRSLL